MASPALQDAPVSPPAPVAPELPAVEWASDPRLADRAPTSEAAPATDPAVLPTGEGDAPKPAATTPEIPTDWKAKLEAADPEFLADFENHPKVKSFIAGRAGFLLQQQRDVEARAARQADLDKSAEAILEVDPDNALAQTHVAERDKQKETDQRVNLLTESFTVVQGGLAEWVQAQPAEVRAEIAKLAPEGKAYGEPGDIKGGFKAYMDDVVAGAVAAALPTARAAWEKDTLPGLRKEVQAEYLGHEPSPDLGVAALSGSGGGSLQEKIDNMSPSQWAKWIAVPANKAAYNAHTSTLGQAA